MNRVLTVAALTLLVATLSSAPARAQSPPASLPISTPAINPNATHSGVGSNKASKEKDPAKLVVSAPVAPADRDPIKEVRQLLRTEKSILEKSEELDINLSRRQADLERLEKQRTVVDEDLRRFEKMFNAKTKALKDARALTRRRLRTLVRLQRVKPYQLLFSGKSYAHVERQLRAVKRLVEADKTRIQAYKKQLQVWRDKRDALVVRRTNLVRTEKKIGFLIKELKWDQQEKQALLKSVREKASFYGQVDAEIKRVDAALVKQVQLLRDRSQKRLWFEESKGKLIRRPIRSGRIVRAFGTRIHRKHKTKTFHPGIDMVPRDKWNGKDPIEIMAMYYGKIVYAGWLRGFGRTVILDHTRGWTTLYGHLERLDVKVGDMVKTGTVIGTMGDSGSLFGKRLHVQIREDGTAINPAPWFP